MRRSRLSIIFILVVAAASLMLRTRLPESLKDSSQASPQPAVQAIASTTLYDVVRVVDGDTIKVMMDGRATTVRLIGVDTPETVKPDTPIQCYGPEASAEMHALLDGKRVSLEMDPTQDRYDAYGRLLAYVFLQDGTLVDELLITDGFGKEYTFKDRPYEYQAEFRSAEATARRAGKGLWGACR
ncbi:MAG TPA: thermonuclease family protein [Candidatus Paceibacterota bacterium]